jgi:hypothetical protein
MRDYSKGKIYTIRNKHDEDLIYVGSTIEEYLSKRFQKHKSHTSCSLYMFINDPNNNTTWDDWYIELYEEHPCENKLQLCKKENEIIRQIANINKIGYKTEEMKKEQEKEWRKQNKEKIAEINKKYCENNRGKILEKKAQYNELNKEHKNEYMKQRYQNNKEELKLKVKEYANKNRDYIHEKIQCSCGCLISRKGIREHERTKKHLESTKAEQTNNNCKLSGY